jgi:hypothetical protein
MITTVEYHHDNIPESWHSPHEYFVVRDTIGRCTAVPDKKGTMIYEGDLLKCNGDERIFTVVWVANSCRFIAMHGELPDRYLLYVGDELQKFATIVGNIHDNPELAGGAK